MKKRLQKSNKNKMIGGVCGGFAEYFNIDPTIVRLIMVILGMINGIGIIVYILCWIIIPKPVETSDDYDDEDIENMKSANINTEEGKTKSKTKSSNSGEKNAAHSDAEFDEFFKK